ncbi:MAG: lipopolysaccharide kinase InaA family protein, partial [Pseudomonadales bacterium]
SKPVDPLARNRLKDLAALLAHLHDKGVWQKDLHLDNFLIAHGQLYAIDGDGVRADGPTLSRRTSLRNLALLLAQLPPSADDGIAALRAAYCEARGWVDDVDTELRRLLVVERNRRVNRYLRKTQRNCTEIEVSSSRRQNFLVLRNLDEALVTQLLRDPDRLVREGEVLKAGNSSTVVRHSSSGSGTFIIKRYNIKNPWHRLRRMFKPVTRFRRAWCNGHRLHFMQIATARPLALLEKRIGPFHGVAYLVMEDLGDQDLSREVATAGLSDARCEEVAKLFALLKAIGVSHGDTKATNFMVHDDKIHLIDLDSMHPGFKRLRTDRDRFLDNWAAPERTRFEAAFQRAGLL